MNKIYLGETEVANVGSGGGGDYVLNSSFNEMTRVAANALIDLKGLEDKLEEQEQALEDQEAALLEEVQTKADVSVVYLKTDIDKADKVSAAALASLNERVSTLEASSGGGGSFDPSDINASIGDISTRVKAIEDDYVVTNDISAFVKENDISVFVTQTALDASYNALDASIIALDASALSFDASIKELAEGGGGGGGGLADSDVPFIRIQNSDGSKWCYVPPTMSDANRTTVLNNVKRNGAIVNEHYNMADRYYGSLSFGTGCSTYGVNSAAFGRNTKADGQNSFAIGYSSNSNSGALAENSFVQGDSCNVNLHSTGASALGRGCIVGYTSGYSGFGEYSMAQGYNTKTYGSYSHAEGRNTQAGDAYKGDESHAEGYYTITYGTASHAEGGYTRTYLDYEHAAGYYNSCSSTGGSTFGSPLNTLSTIGNGVKDSSRHNAFEVRQSGDIYIPDVSAAGNYYEKPMIHLQQKLYAIDASINALEQGGGGGGSSFDPTNYTFV